MQSEKTKTTEIDRSQVKQYMSKIPSLQDREKLQSSAREKERAFGMFKTPPCRP